MRTFLRFVVVVLLVLVCASPSVAQEGLDPDMARKIEQVRDRERLIRLRAEQIRLAKEVAEAEKALRKSEPREERQARKEVEKTEKKVAKAQENAEKAVQRSAITGCEAGTVDVHPSVAPRWTINSSVRIRVTNPEQVPINIEDVQHGLIVRNLCPGGSLTIFRARNIADPDRMSFRFTAKARFPDGSLGMDQSRSYRLSSRDWSSGRGRQEYDWTIRLRKVRSANR